MDQVDVSTTGMIYVKIQRFLKTCWRRRFSDGLRRNQRGRKDRPGNSDKMSKLKKIFQNIQKLFIALSE